jgi:hypothetical protein
MRAIIALLLCSACSFAEGVAHQPPDSSGSGSGSATAFQPGKEIVAGGGRVTVGTITMDVQIGHGILPRKSTVGTISVSANAVVRP